MPEHLQGVLYTATAVMEGGREGHGRSLDRQLDATESQVICRVGFGPTGHGGFGLTVAPDLHMPFLMRERGADLLARARERCPYSDATRGNIDVALSVDGVLLPGQHSGPAAGRGEPA